MAADDDIRFFPIYEVTDGGAADMESRMYDIHFCRIRWSVWNEDFDTALLYVAITGLNATGDLFLRKFVRSVERRIGPAGNAEETNVVNHDTTTVDRKAEPREQVVGDCPIVRW